MTRCGIFPFSAPGGKGRGRTPGGDRPRQPARGGARSWALVLASLAVLPLLPARATPLDWDRYPASLAPPLPFHQLVITAVDSVRIAAWYVPPTDSAGIAVSGRRPAVLVFPREGESMESRLGIIAGFAHRGFAVLAFDQRGTGASGGFDADPRALVYPEFLTDASAALDILWRRPEVDTTRVAAYGESRGALLALALAGRRPELRAVVAVSPPENARTWYKALNAQHPDAGWFLPKGWQQRDEPDRVMRRFNGAIFFVTGDADLDTPAWMAEELHGKYPRPKELWVIEGAGHAGPKSPEHLLGDRFHDRVAGFLYRELAKPPHRGWPYR
jgi:pimeloyl-ACP methyl ester carboxylesterase